PNPSGRRTLRPLASCSDPYVVAAACIRSMFTTPLSNPCWVMVPVGPAPAPIQPSLTASWYGSDHTAVPFQRWNGTAVWTDPYQEAVKLGWIGAGAGPTGTITQHGFDSGVVNMLRMQAAATTYGSLHEANGRRVRLPLGFGAEQIVRHLGVRVNAPAGSDTWEWWPQ